ncbi:hypothetical protein PoB_000418000 [Plakobranchus ocellatus]|uniref:Uncharacterized protein n=1 Tax=Plakobranchus ocellatus TaxID=259542 RepID=A0AAV3Y3R1_9GAST|nr:hypothetical protein PoB_000418000 [Plakobranchus ocellatus]
MSLRRGARTEIQQPPRSTVARVIPMRASTGSRGHRGLKGRRELPESVLRETDGERYLTHTPHQTAATFGARGVEGLENLSVAGGTEVRQSGSCDATRSTTTR